MRVFYSNYAHYACYIIQIIREVCNSEQGLLEVQFDRFISKRPAGGAVSLQHYMRPFRVSNDDPVQFNLIIITVTQTHTMACTTLMHA